MSRLARKPLPIPAGVTVAVSGSVVSVKGPKGALEKTLPVSVHIAVDANAGVAVTVDHPDQSGDKALQGLWVRLIQNMIVGVSVGFERVLEVEGIGYKVVVKGKEVVLDIGFSHEVPVALPAGIEAVAEKNVLRIRGIDKEAVGGFAVFVRNLRPPEPYKGKGIRYQGEIIRRKAGKAAKTSAG
ncbi:50S ribosomal protein L6 [Candidatus Uhrbacteria bacterium]|nr:50S ribosomal protein L6 [Candidatus Uhrbacteria bacterium]